MTRSFDIIETATGEIVKTVATSLEGDEYDRFLADLYGETDYARFRIVAIGEVGSP